ncbi:hypothetical protein [Lacipirellula sp.]|uniref:hypothetical protein n=1 Tax=Lacipirellula sp. TaxID=2691419 RepID=UPI003D0A076B
MRRITGLKLTPVLAAVLGGLSPAREYLWLTAAAFPERFASSYLPLADSLVVGSMVAESNERHMTGKVDVEAMNRLAAIGFIACSELSAVQWPPATTVREAS